MGALSRGLVAFLALTGGFISAGCTPDSAGSPHGSTSSEVDVRQAQRRLDVGFESKSLDGPGGVGNEPVVVGDGLQLEAVRSNDASVTSVAGRDGGRAVRIEAGERADSAAALMVSGEDGEVLAPNGAPFRFGIDFRPSRMPSSGANLMQRGLFGSAGQYKLQIDDGIPSCRVSGATGEVLVKADVSVSVDTWYRAICERDDGLVTLRLGVFAQGAIEWSEWRGEGLTGPIDAGEPAFPMAIGGKLNAKGGLVIPAEDQFAGVVDNIFFEVLR